MSDLTDALEAALLAQLEAGGVVETQTGDERTRFAQPLEMAKALGLLQQQSAASGGTSFFTATPG